MHLNFKVDKPIEEVFYALSDMQKFVSVHPVIKKIDQLGDNNYLIHETLRFALLPFSFKYPATVESSDLGKSVVMKAHVWKMVKIKMEFVLRKDNTSTIIDEDVEFRSKLPVRLIMEAVFKKQHKLLFENIEVL